MTFEGTAIESVRVNMPEPSRIFVRGLPPQIKDKEFVSHFSKIAPITDSKCLAHRRIGYVGYKTPDIAQTAVRYYNRSFIRTSRIKVELAKPVRLWAKLVFQ